MQIAASADGAPIAWLRSGRGPPFLLGHGTTDHTTTWRIEGDRSRNRRPCVVLLLDVQAAVELR
jgi:hypothetical protein